MQKKPRIIIFLYNRLFDPLIESNFWLYIKDFLEDKKNPYDFHVITYENPKFPLTQEQKKQINIWESQGLEWSSLRWHQGSGLKEKFIDLFNGFKTVSKLD